MDREIKIGGRTIGDGFPTYVVAEVGINHNGDLDIAEDMIIKAKEVGADAVKFQKRTPELCVPEDQRDRMRETPWGYITYMEYRERMEFGKKEYSEIQKICHDLDLDWFVSVWDEPSVDFMEEYDPICYKIASASLTDHSFLRKVRATGRPIILSTGMSTFEQIKEAVNVIMRLD